MLGDTRLDRRPVGAESRDLSSIAAHLTVWLESFRYVIA